jgi:4-carboxymuconolactone decarboxylase
MTTKLERGKQLIDELHGEHTGEKLMNVLSGICPDYVDMTAEFAFATVFDRPGLDVKTRELIIISLCTALGDMENQLRAHIEAAIISKATKQEITESILQTCLYAGFARVTNALLIAKEYLGE